MILSDIQSLTPGNMVTLYELDCQEIGGVVERYHNHTDGPIVWQGYTYHPWAIEAADFERTGEGQQPNPVIRLGNIGVDEHGERIEGVISALCIALGDLRGARLMRRRTFAKYLDAVNFPGGNPTANPNEEMSPEIWIVEQKTTEARETVSFMLSSPLDFADAKLPARQIIAGTCGWLWIGGYRGPYCGYTGSRMFDREGNAVTDPVLDKCGGRPTDCQKRFGEYQVINFGGFPAADRIR